MPLRTGCETRVGQFGRPAAARAGRLEQADRINRVVEDAQHHAMRFGDAVIPAEVERFLPH